MHALRECVAAATALVDGRADAWDAAPRAALADVALAAGAWARSLADSRVDADAGVSRAACALVDELDALSGALVGAGARAGHAVAARSRCALNVAVGVGPAKPSPPLEFETEHEYTNNANWVEKVEFPGAVALVITFDEQTRTEPNYDYLAFYTDEACQQRVEGTEEKYHGQDPWPGKGECEPLRLPLSRFWFRWVTDNSGTTWGWKMTVTPEFPEVGYVAMACRIRIRRLNHSGVTVIARRFPEPPKEAEDADAAGEDAVTRTPAAVLLDTSPLFCTADDGAATDNDAADAIAPFVALLDRATPPPGSPASDTCCFYTSA